MVGHQIIQNVDSGRFSHDDDSYYSDFDEFTHQYGSWLANQMESIVRHKKPKYCPFSGLYYVRLFLITYYRGCHSPWLWVPGDLVHVSGDKVNFTG